MMKQPALKQTQVKIFNLPIDILIEQQVSLKNWGQVFCDFWFCRRKKVACRRQFTQNVIDVIAYFREQQGEHKVIQKITQVFEKHAPAENDFNSFKRRQQQNALQSSYASRHQTLPHQSPTGVLKDPIQAPTQTQNITTVSDHIKKVSDLKNIWEKKPQTANVDLRVPKEQHGNPNIVQQERMNKNQEPMKNIEKKSPQIIVQDAPTQIVQSIPTENVTSSQQTLASIHRVRRAQSFVEQPTEIIKKKKNFSLQEINAHYIPRTHQVIKIQSQQRKRVARRAYLQMRKRHRYRMNVIKEIIVTEERFITDLNFLVNTIITPLKAIISPDDIKGVFINITSILGLNMAILPALQKQFAALTKPNSKGSYKYYQETTSDVVHMIAFFRLYHDYCKEYVRAGKILDRLNKVPQFVEFFQDLKQKNTLKGYDLQDYLIKPVQRLPKYVLLFKDLLKHTDEDHPDYKNIKKCLDEISKINSENDEKMEKLIASNKMTELQQMFPELNLAKSTNEFIFEETINIYLDSYPYSAIMYAFSDQIIFTHKNDQQTEKKLLVVELNQLSLCKDQPDSKFFKNQIQIVGVNEIVQTQCSSKEVKDKILAHMTQILKTLKERAMNKIANRGEDHDLHQVLVSVVGTEERGGLQVWRYTVYITEILIGSVEVKIFLRYSQVIELEQIIKKNFPRLNIPHLSSIAWGGNHTPKVIEERRLLIEKFLQVVLASDDVKKNPEIVLKSLNLPTNFYRLPNIKKQDDGHQFDIKTITENQKISATQLIQATRQSHNLVSLCTQTNIVIGDESQKSEYEAQVQLMDGSNFAVGFEKESRVREIIDAICQHIKLLKSIDFKLFTYEPQSGYKTIDDDETLASILDLEKKIRSSGQVMSKMKSMINSKQVKERPKVIMRKYFFLDSQIEQIDYENDDMRLRLITFQLIQDVKDDKYNFGPNEYALYISYYLYLTVSDQYIFPVELIKTWIPPNTFKIHNLNWWTEAIMVNYEGIVAKYKDMKDQKRQCMRVILNSIKHLALFGMTAYAVECKSAIQTFKKMGMVVPANIFVGLNHVGLHFIVNKEILRTYKYSEVKDLKSYSSEVVIEFEEDERLQLNTVNGYEMKVLWDDYRQFQEFKKGLHK